MNNLRHLALGSLSSIAEEPLCDEAKISSPTVSESSDTNSIVTKLSLSDSLLAPIDEKSMSRPTIKLKVMQWKKLAPREIPGTLWETVDVSKISGLVQLDEINRLFAAPKQSNAVTLSLITPLQEDKDEDEGSVSAILKGLLTVEEKMMVSIVLNKVPYDESELAEALQRMDDSIFGPGLASRLRRIFTDEKIPTSLIQQLAIYHGNMEHISDRCDRFVIKVNFEQDLATVSYYSMIDSV